MAFKYRALHLASSTSPSCRFPHGCHNMSQLRSRFHSDLVLREVGVIQLILPCIRRPSRHLHGNRRLHLFIQNVVVILLVLTTLQLICYSHTLFSHWSQLWPQSPPLHLPVELQNRATDPGIFACSRVKSHDDGASLGVLLQSAQAPKETSRCKTYWRRGRFTR